ncbi:MAG: hypothetical protein DI629_07860 [Mesorhizobium amorphae]|nr:MAG: hypothetical protein DI629_07860 [Mesorhizobium amorphae]
MAQVLHGIATIRPVALLLAEGQGSVRHGADLLLPVLPRAHELIGDRGYDSNRFQDTLTEGELQKNEMLVRHSAALVVVVSPRPV